MEILLVTDMILWTLQLWASGRRRDPTRNKLEHSYSEQAEAQVGPPASCLCCCGLMLDLIVCTVFKLLISVADGLWKFKFGAVTDAVC